MFNARLPEAIVPALLTTAPVKSPPPAGVALPKYSPFCTPEMTPPSWLSIVPLKLTPFTKRTPAVVPLSPSESIVPELVMFPVNRPEVVASRAPSTRVRSKRTPSPAVVSPAPATPRPWIVPVLLMSKLFPSAESSVEKPAPRLPSPASITPSLLRVKS